MNTPTHIEQSQMTQAQSNMTGLKTRLGRVVLLVGGWASSVSGLILMLTVSLMSSPVMAQQQAIRPPQTREDPVAPKFMIYLVALLLVAGVVFAATLKSKRTHQD